MKKTTIQVTFDIHGVRTADRFAMANDHALRSKGEQLKTGLESATKLPSIDWPVPYPFEGHPEEYESTLINSVASSVNVAVLGRIESNLDDLFSFTDDPRFKSILASLSISKIKSSTASTKRSYEIEFTNPSVCRPCGEFCHYCNGIVTTADGSSQYSPLIWVGRSHSSNFNFNVLVQYKFILETV
jgi:hypothetical protein